MPFQVAKRLYTGLNVALPFKIGTLAEECLAYCLADANSSSQHPDIISINICGGLVIEELDFAFAQC